MSKADPTISMITVCRNSVATIGTTIESVLSQRTAGAVEYIIVDGDSHDGTQDIVRSYGERIDRFISEPDQGISDAFNKGIKLARGGIIGLINSDDRLADDSLALIERYFQEHPDVDGIHGDLLLYEKGRLIKRLKPPGYWWFPWRLIVINHPATFVRRTVYDRYGMFNTGLRYAMDIDIFLRWQKGGACIKYLPEVLACMEAGGIGGVNAFAAFAEGRKVMVTNGYSPFLASVQYLGRCAVQSMLNLRSMVKPGL